jgi:hypothetical protein
MSYSTYRKIATTTAATAQASLEFTSIPQTYDDLVIFISGRSTRTGSTADYGLISFNGSTSSFTGRQLSGNGASAVTNTGARETGTFPATDATTSTFSNGFIYIPGYTTSNNKSFSVDNVSENNGTTAYQVLGAQLWSNTSAITSITLTLGNGPNWAANSSATLYGIKRA